MAMTKTITPGDSVTTFSIAGPGHSPTKPLPMLNRTELTTSGRSITVGNRTQTRLVGDGLDSGADDHLANKVG